jgi:serine/threonine protein kinase
MEPADDRATPESLERLPEHERAQRLLEGLQAVLEAREAELSFIESESSGLIQGMLDFVRGLREQRKREREHAKATRELLGHVLQMRSDLTANPADAGRHLPYIEQLYQRASAEHGLETLNRAEWQAIQEDYRLRLAGEADAAAAYVAREVDQVDRRQPTEAERQRLRQLFADLTLIGQVQNDMAGLNHRQGSESDPAKRAALKKAQADLQRDVDGVFENRITGGVLPIHRRQYQFGEKIGMGGMGVVMAGTDLASGEAVAIKLLQPTDREEMYRTTFAGRSMRRSINEIAALHRLSSQTVVQETVRPDGTTAMTRSRQRREREGNWPPITMLLEAQMIPHPDTPTQRLSAAVIERVKGQDLQAELKPDARRLDPSDLYNLGGQLANGVRFMHEAGVYHRDLKAANLMVTEDKQLRILDFGIAFIPELSRKQMAPSERMAKSYSRRQQPGRQASGTGGAEAPTPRVLDYAVEDRRVFVGTFMYMPDVETTDATTREIAALQETAQLAGDRYRTERQSLVDAHLTQLVDLQQHRDLNWLTDDQYHQELSRLNAEYRRQLGELLQADVAKQAMAAAERLTKAITEQSRRRDYYGTGMVLYRLADQGFRLTAQEPVGSEKRAKLQWLQYVACRLIAENEHKPRANATPLTIEQVSQMLKDWDDPKKQAEFSEFLKQSDTQDWLQRMRQSVAGKRDRVTRRQAAIAAARAAAAAPAETARPAEAAPPGAAAQPAAK